MSIEQIKAEALHEAAANVKCIEELEADYEALRIASNIVNHQRGILEAENAEYRRLFDEVNAENDKLRGEAKDWKDSYGSIKALSNASLLALSEKGVENEWLAGKLEEAGWQYDGEHHDKAGWIAKAKAEVDNV